MASHEDGYGKPCEQMFSLPESKDRASETSEHIATIENSWMEIGEHFHGFRDGFAENIF